MDSRIEVEVRRDHLQGADGALQEIRLTLVSDDLEQVIIGEREE